ncbi:MAG: hypothetical protein ABEJ65_09555, partial [bacterium]
QNSDTKAPVGVNVAALGKDHPRVKNYPDFRSPPPSGKPDLNLSDTLYSAMDVSPDGTATMKIFFNVQNVSDTNEIALMHYKADSGWVADKTTTVSETSTSVSAEVSSFSSWGLSPVKSSSTNGSNGSSSSCIIEQISAPESVINGLRNTRDRVLVTALGRALTKFYYSL